MSEERHELIYAELPEIYTVCLLMISKNLHANITTHEQYLLLIEKNQLALLPPIEYI